MKYTYLVCCILSFIIGKGQTLDEYRAYTNELSLAGGSIRYFGDLNSTKPYWNKEGNFFAQLALRRHLTDYIFLRGMLSIGQITADDSNAPNGYLNYRSASFHAQLVEAAALVELYPFRNRNYECRCGFFHVFSPFVSLGLGYIHTNPVLTVAAGALSPPDADLLNKDKQNLRKSAISIPFGIGLKIGLSQRMSAGVETLYRFTNSDYLDGFAAAGNPTNLDGFSTLSLSISYSFPR